MTKTLINDNNYYIISLSKSHLPQQQKFKKIQKAFIALSHLFKRADKNCKRMTASQRDGHFPQADHVCMDCRGNSVSRFAM